MSEMDAALLVIYLCLCAYLIGVGCGFILSWWRDRKHDDPKTH